MARGGGFEPPAFPVSMGRSGKLALALFMPSNTTGSSFPNPAAKLTLSPVELPAYKFIAALLIALRISDLLKPLLHQLPAAQQAFRCGEVHLFQRFNRLLKVARLLRPGVELCEGETLAKNLFL